MLLTHFLLLLTSARVKVYLSLAGPELLSNMEKKTRHVFLLGMAS